MSVWQREGEPMDWEKVRIKKRERSQQLSSLKNTLSDKRCPTWPSKPRASACSGFHTRLSASALGGQSRGSLFDRPALAALLNCKWSQAQFAAHWKSHRLRWWNFGTRGLSLFFSSACQTAPLTIKSFATRQLCYIKLWVSAFTLPSTLCSHHLFHRREGMGCLLKKLVCSFSFPLLLLLWEFCTIQFWSYSLFFPIPPRSFPTTRITCNVKA